MKNFKKVLLYIILITSIYVAQVLVSHYIGWETSVYVITIGFLLTIKIWPPSKINN